MPLNNKKITRRNFLKFSFAGLALIAAGDFISTARPAWGAEAARALLAATVASYTRTSRGRSWT